MKKVYLSGLVALAGVGAVLSLSGCGGSDAQAQTAPAVFTVSSPDIASNSVPAKFMLGSFGCTGQNVSPTIQWRNAPAGTKSFALQVLDLDAPTGSGFWHWTVYDIPATATELAQGAGNSAATLPTGAYGGMSDFHDTGSNGGNGNYGGFCPPVGETHRYVFSLYALGVDKVAPAANIPKTGTAAVYGFALNRGLGANILAKSTFTVTFGR